MKHETLARALSELDDELLVEAETYRPRQRGRTRLLTAAACLALVVAAALSLARPKADIYLGETLLERGGIALDVPAPLALDGRAAEQPLSLSLRLAFGDEDAHTVSVSDGVLDSPLDSFPHALSERTAGHSDAFFTWRIDSPARDAVYTLSIDGRAAMTLHCGEDGWRAEKT